MPVVLCYFSRMANSKPKQKKATARPERADLVVPVKGTDSIATLAKALGAKADGHSYSFAARFEVCGEATVVARSAAVSAADRDQAVSELSLRDQETFARLSTFVAERAKAIAEARVTGQSATRETWRGFVRA